MAKAKITFQISYIFLLQFFWYPCPFLLLFIGTSTCKAIGVQTEISGESTHLSSKNDLSTCQRRRSNLLAVWDSPKGKGSPRNLVSKLLVACETDFHVLFGCLSLSFKAGMKSLADEWPSDVRLRDHNPPTQSAEAAKVSHLYYVLTKVSISICYHLLYRYGSRVQAVFYLSFLVKVCYHALIKFQL